MSQLSLSLQYKIPPPIIALIIGFCIWVCSYFLPIFNISVSEFYYIGIGLIVLGLSLDVISLFYFIKNKTTINPITPEKTTHLVISGFYRWTRNPMYLGLLFILVGNSLLFSSLFALFFLPLFVFIINTLQIKPEEKILEQIFSQQYIDYKNKVSRWL
jgi:protein-S-isoprenylcysteine O-methyltransferase Ste14